MSLFNKRLNLIFIPFFVVLIFFSIGYIVKNSDYFKIKKIYINKQMISERTMRSILQEDAKESLLLIDSDKLQKRFQNFYSTHQVQVIKHYPDVLDVNIVFNDIICYFYINGQNQHIFWALNQHSQIIQRTMRVKTGIPIISASLDSFENLKWEHLKRNKYLKFTLLKEICRSLAIIKDLDLQFFSKIKNIYIFKNSKRNFFKLKDLRSQFIFGSSMNLSQLLKLYTLEVDLISRINFKTVDLRFDDVIGRN